MNTSRTGHTPAPAAMARCGTPVPGGVCAAPATPPPPPPAARAVVRRTPYDRRRWEEALLACAGDGRIRLVGFVLAHYAGPGGYLREDGIQNRSRLRTVTRLSPQTLKMALRGLERAGLIWRPDPPSEHTRRARPITLVMPAARAPRDGLPHTGPVPG